MTYTTNFEANPQHHDIQILYDGLKAHMLAKRDLKPIDFFGYFIKDENGNIAGGCNGCFMYGCLVVDTLWVADALRGHGWGTQLMQSAQQLGVENACRFITVNTMDWEALDFYKKLGFYVEFERQGYDKDSVFYFLRKELP